MCGHAVGGAAVAKFAGDAAFSAIAGRPRPARSVWIEHSRLGWHRVRIGRTRSREFTSQVASVRRAVSTGGQSDDPLRQQEATQVGLAVRRVRGTFSTLSGDDVRSRTLALLIVNVHSGRPAPRWIDPEGVGRGQAELDVVIALVP